MNHEELAEKAAQWWTDRLQQGDKDLFKSSLKASIKAELDKYGRSMTCCDYDPMGILLDAVRDAGVECRGFLFSADGILPGKTDLRIHEDGKIEVWEGYGAGWRELAD